MVIPWHVRAALPHEEVDFSLLKEEEEWELLFVFVLPYQDMLLLALDGLFLHRICQFLAALSGTFSRYYNRVHVLKGHSSALPTTMARMKLLKAVKDIYAHAFGLLQIEPVYNM